MPGILDHNPLYAVFHGTYSMAITLAVVLGLVGLVNLWQHKLRAGLLFFALTASCVVAAVDLGTGTNIIVLPAAMAAQAMLMLVIAGIVIWKSKASTDQKLLQAAVPATLASLSATFASSLSVEAYAIGSPDRLLWAQLDSYLWGSNLVMILLFITCAVVIATAGLGRASSKKLATSAYEEDDDALVNDSVSGYSTSSSPRRWKNPSLPDFSSWGRRKPTATDDDPDSDIDADSIDTSDERTTVYSGQQ